MIKLNQVGSYTLKNPFVQAYTFLGIVHWAVSKVIIAWEE